MLENKSRQTITRRIEALTGITFVLPAVALITLCLLLPMLVALGLSLTRCSRILDVHWVGLDNYRRVLADPNVLKALGVTLSYALLFVPGTVGIALGVAMLLNRRFPGMKLIRSVYFVPVAVSAIVTISIFRFLFDTGAGPINAVLKTIGFAPVAWFKESPHALISVVTMTLWKSTAFFSIIILAALQDVPKELYEAAEVDGAGPVKRFLNVTVPSIRGILVTVMTLSAIQAFRVFEPMFVLTNGGPENSTRTIALLVYDAAFRAGELGYANAIAFVLLGIILVMTLLLRRITGERHS
jgi:multiple sugar transport system permease protein